MASSNIVAGGGRSMNTDWSTANCLKVARGRRSKQSLVLELKVGTVGPAADPYDALFALYQRAQTALQNVQDVVFDFDDCSFLHHNEVAFLGGVIRLLQVAGCQVWVKSLAPRVRANLSRNGFLSKLGLTDKPMPLGNAIPFRQDHAAAGVMRYLRDDWLGRGWVNVSAAVQDAIATNVWEIYGNAFEHGTSPTGVFSCGQHYPQRQEIALTVVDFGVGIPGSVRSVPAFTEMEDEEAIAWALLPGTTSKQGNRGLGLNLLSEFTRLNRGRVDILSHRGFVKIGSGRILRLRSQHHFRGTLLNIMLKEDERRYVFAGEIDQPLL